jgi:mono/diheme cytochrome c family protein
MRSVSRFDRRLLLGLGFGAILVAAVAYALWQPRGAPDLNDGGRIEAGALVYARHCASCHGDNLQGHRNWTTRLANGRMPAPPHDDTGHTWHHPSAVLFGITKLGLKPPYAPPDYQSDMPAFGPLLSDDDIWNALAFIRSRWSAAVRTKHDAMDRE